MKRRVIDVAQRMPANVPAAIPVDNSPKMFPTVEPTNDVSRDRQLHRVAVPPRSIQILRSPVPSQVPVLGSSRVNSSLARAMADGGEPGGAEGQVRRDRKRSVESRREAVRSQSVIK